MNVNELKTPAFLVDLNVLEKNISHYQFLTDNYRKKIVPMTKTHKSTTIAKMQFELGASGFVVGTIDEAIQLSKIGVKEITIPYPLLGKKVLEMMKDISERVNLILSVDSLEVMKEYNDFFKYYNKRMECLLIINTGLNRFGISPINAGKMALKLNEEFTHLKFKGISTHPGQVYGEIDRIGVEKISFLIYQQMKLAMYSLYEYKITPEIVATGSTPTFLDDVKMDIYTHLRPGNYVFFDRMQMMLGSTTEKECSLTVLATVISHPSEHRFILDCGSKCLGLDKGAHSSTNIIGYGHVVNHPELIIKSLSEEVAIVEAVQDTSIKIGDKLQIIPNHSCSVANMTNYLIGHKNNIVESIIEVDMRGNSVCPKI